MNGIHAASGQQPVVNADSPKLKSAAHEFEASLMKEFLKPLEHDSLFAEDKSGDSDEQGSAGTLMSFGSQAMAKAISEHGGFGIAAKILDHFRTHPGAPFSNNASVSK
ncbi:MAG TPA: hypothetical protein VHT28_17205 [Silvibacterium sp.]|jgi:Rod binding domain-containing protein|nr:hypothetical protein [Silvibacterium sp.]